MVWFCRLNIIDPSTHFHVMVFIQESELINPSDFFLNLSWHNCIETSNFNARLIDQAQDYAEERIQCSQIASTITTTKDRVFPRGLCRNQQNQRQARNYSLTNKCNQQAQQVQ